FGSLQLDDERRTTVLVGRRDLSPPRGVAPADPARAPDADPDPNADADPNPEYVILLHPAYRHGSEAISIQGAWFRHLARPGPGDEFRLPDQAPDPGQAIDLDYRDPLESRNPASAGRWLAGFALVGNTGLAVIVQQRYETAVAPGQTLALNAFLWAGVALSLGTVLVFVVGYGARRVVDRRGRLAPTAVET